jgi:hypothetical protein
MSAMTTSSSDRAVALANGSGSEATGGSANALSDKKNIIPTNEINVMIDEAFESIQLKGYSSKTSVEDALAEILTIVPGGDDESLEISSSVLLTTSTISRRVYSEIASRIVKATSMLSTAGTTSEDDKSCVSNEEFVEICSEEEQQAVLVERCHMSDVSSGTTSNSTATTNPQSKTTQPDHSTLLRTDTDDAQASVEVNVSGQPTTTSSGGGNDDDDIHEGRFEVDSSGCVAYQTDRHNFPPPPRHQRPTRDNPSLEHPVANYDPLEESSNYLPTSRVTNVDRTNMNRMHEETKTSKNEQWSYEVDFSELQAIDFNRTSSSLTSTCTRKKMETISQNAATRSKNQSNGNASHEVDLEDHIVVYTREAYNACSVVQQEKTSMSFPTRWLASKSSTSRAAGQLSPEIELADLVTAPTRITSNMSSQQARANLPSSCLSMFSKSKSFRYEQFEVEDVGTVVSRTSTIGLVGFDNNNSDDDSLQLTEEEKEISFVSSTTPKHYTLLQITEFPQALFMGKELHSNGGADVDTEKRVIQRTDTNDTEEDEVFDEEAQSNAEFEVTVHDSEQTIAVMQLEAWMESCLRKSGKRQQQ